MKNVKTKILKGVGTFLGLCLGIVVLAFSVSIIGLLAKIIYLLFNYGWKFI
jgi:hypothetical protein